GKDFWIVQIGNNGNLASSVALGGSGSDFAYAIVEPGIVAGAAFSDDGDVIDLQGTSDGWVMQLDYATGINASAQQPAEISLYPNPVTDRLTIDLKNNSGCATFAIKNVLGQNISFESSNEKRLFLDVSGYPQGIYFMEVVLNNGGGQHYFTSFEVNK
ncbi:MAG: T9SS type A sorting domain-containing protein, partial [Chitinophagales bacterium]